jgi:Protein of unknown function (DUF1573)
MPATAAYVILTLLAAPASASSVAPATLETSFDFGAVKQGATVEHAFAIENPGSAPLRIERVALTPPLVVRRMPAVIPPGGRALLEVELPTASVAGTFTGDILVATSDPVNRTLELELTGHVMTAVEVLPRRAAFLTGTREAPGSASLDIVNNEDRPIRIESVEHSRGLFTSRVETIEHGRRWRLVLSLLPDGPAGKRSERITLRTTSRASPTITVVAYTYLRERVYAFPDAVDLGAIRAADLRDSGFSARLAQTLMVYQVGGSTFEARFRTDVPGVAVTAERGPKGDRWQATVRIAGTPKPGPVSGKISIETNDPSFPRLEVPVTGTILD